MAGRQAQNRDDVVVIGAGIVGVCCALQLAERGLSVTVIDRKPPCEETSFGNAGVISPWSCVPQSVPGLWRKLPKWLLDPQGPVFIRKRHAAIFLPWALKFLSAGRRDRIDGIGDAMMALSRNSPSNYRALLQGTPELELVRDSVYVFVYRQAQQANLDQLGWRMRRTRDVPLSLIDAGELREREPHISPEYEAAILIHEQGRALNPAAIGKAIAAKARSMGVRFVLSETKAISRDGDGWSAVCEDRQYNGAKLVLASGVWSASLLKPFGFHLPLEAERGYHLLCRNPGIQINNSIMDVEHMCVASQMAAGVRVAGTAEFAGIQAAPDNRRAFVFRNVLKSLFPGINTDQAEPWMGRRPTFPDSLPCIGQVGGHDGLFAAFGHSHYGLSQAPTTGRIIADCVTGRTPEMDLQPYRTGRFT
ncbi:MAG: NAD(P)/FAD-dependent oxidoreductase [Candidatus Puniceispirillaceae bacterium]